MPVSRPKRAGVLVDEVVWALVKRMPSAAMRSMFGVAMVREPLQEMSPKPRSSARMTMTFGRSCSVRGACACARAEVGSAAAPSPAIPSERRGVLFIMDRVCLGLPLQRYDFFTLPCRAEGKSARKTERSRALCAYAAGRSTRSRMPRERSDSTTTVSPVRSLPSRMSVDSGSSTCSARVRRSERTP